MPSAKKPHHFQACPTRVYWCVKCGEHETNPVHHPFFVNAVHHHDVHEFNLLLPWVCSQPATCADCGKPRSDPAHSGSVELQRLRSEVEGARANARIESDALAARTQFYAYRARVEPDVEVISPWWLDP